MSKSKRLSQCVMLVFLASDFSTRAMASSPSAWSAHDQEVTQACTKASGLTKAVVTGKPMIFDDSVGLTALLVSGRYPQPHMKYQTGHVLCLYDRKTRKANIAPADQLRLATPAKSANK